MNKQQMLKSGTIHGITDAHDKEIGGQHDT
jgi:hypothetical protein